MSAPKKAKIEQWWKWNVWGVEIPGGFNYYEVNTGFFVGYEVSSGPVYGKLVLVNTNADIPTIE
jgi:hypothetical protein